MALKEWITGLGYKLEIQTNTDFDNPIYSDMSDITLAVAESFNETLDTWNTMQSVITSSNKTAIDPEFTLTAKGDKTHPAMLSMLDTILAAGSAAVRMVRLTNTFSRKVLVFPATVSGYNPTFETPTVVEIPWSLKPYDGTQVQAIDVDTAAPTVVTYTPADDATGVAGDVTLQLEFDNPVIKGVGDIKIYNDADALIESINVQLSGVVVSGVNVTINRAVTLPADSYYAQITQGAFTDIAGNKYAGIADKTTWSFDVT